MGRYLTQILATDGFLSLLALFVNADFYSRVFCSILVLYCVAGIMLLRFGHQSLLRIVTPFLFWLVFSGLIFSGYGIHSVSVSTLPLLIIISALLGGRRVAYLYTTLSVITLLVTWIGEQKGYISNGMSRPSSLQDLFNLYIIHAFVLALVVALMRHIDNDRLEAIRKEERFNVLSSNLHDMVWTTDLALNIEFITPSVERILGYTPNELIGTSFAEIMPLESFDAARELLEVELDLTQRGLSPDKFKSVQSEVRCKDGTVRWLNARISFLHDDRGEIFGTVGSAHDISEQKASLEVREVLETQLHKAQKMEALGHFAGGIVHDFNNILVAVQGYSELASRSAKDTEKTLEYTAEIQKAADRAAGLTRQLLNFGRGNDTERRPFGVNTMIEGIRGMLQRLLPENIRFELETGDEEPIVDGVPGQFEQLVMNLALNARDAMPQGGVLRLESEIVDGVGDTGANGDASLAGRYARIRVTDTGCGIGEEDLPNVFEPFFTTKDSAHGTGLGMSVVQGIVERHGGRIEIQSTVGEGTTITAHFPVALPDRRDHASRGDDLPVGGSERILLVEDNIHVQHVVAQLLLKAGYSVLTASNGDEGLAVFEKNRKSIHAVLTDLVMPEMGGFQLMQRIREIDPDMPVLFTSGYAVPPDVAYAISTGSARLIQKPYRPTTLLRFVRAMLDHSRAAS